MSFDLGDMAVEMKAAKSRILDAGWTLDQGTVPDADTAMAKLGATKRLAMVADETMQIPEGLSFMEDLPLERGLRPARRAFGGAERGVEGGGKVGHIRTRSALGS